MNVQATPQFRVDLPLLRTEEWNKYCEMGTARRIYELLINYVVRSKFKSYRDPLDLYNSYYMNGMLVARWSQMHIADKLGINQSNVSRNIKKLENAGYIVKHKKILYGKACVIYQLGTHSNNVERIYLIERLRASLNAKKEEDIVAQQEEYYESLETK